MPHNRYYLAQVFHDNALLTLEDAEFHHVTRVMRQKEGDTIELINGQGSLAEAVITKIDKQKAIARVTALQIEQKNEKAPSLTLVLAYLKPANLEFSIEKCVELGVTEIWLFEALRSEKKVLSELYIKRLETIIISACKQCGRLFLPKLIIKKSLQSCLEAISSNVDTQAFFGDLQAEQRSFKDYLSSITKSAYLFIGPESGFSDDERALLRASKAHGVRFHSNILRAETAAIAGTALLWDKIVNVPVPEKNQTSSTSTY